MSANDRLLDAIDDAVCSAIDSHAEGNLEGWELALIRTRIAEAKQRNKDTSHSGITARVNREPSNISLSGTEIIAVIRPQNLDKTDE
jgi:hypothetical protein